MASFSASFGQQRDSTQQTVRRLRRTETRTTTDKLYPERDTIVALLKRRMAVISADSAATQNGTDYFASDAAITDASGTNQSPAQYLQQKLTYRDYRLRKLEINEDKANATETYTLPTPNGPAKTATVTSSLKKGANGQWQITQMKVSSK